MKKLIGFLMLSFAATLVYAQKVAYKSGIISMDGKDIAKVSKIKDKASFGLVSSYELLALNGDKLVVATMATDFEPESGNNMDFYYILSFLPTGQTGVFSLSKLGAEKKFAKLIGESGIVAGNGLDQTKVAEFIASKGKRPRLAVNYDLVSRNSFGQPTLVQSKKGINQGGEIIGHWSNTSHTAASDTYQFKLPSGLIVATAIFSGGNEATSFMVSTARDSQTRTVPMKTGYGKITISSEGVDPNLYAIEFIARWLVKNGYL